MFIALRILLLTVISISALNGILVAVRAAFPRHSIAAGKENVPARLTLQVSHNTATIFDQ
jgi:hypothetical protein